MNLVRAELLKLRTVRSNVVMIVLAVAFGIGFSVLVPLIVPKGENGVEPGVDLFPLALAGLGIAQALCGVLGILVMAQEHRYTMRVTFAAEPRRWRVLAAKAVAVTIVVSAIAVVVVVVGLVAGGAVLDARGFPLDTGSGFWRATAGAVVSTVLQALVGLGFGAIVPSAAAAITVYVVWPLVVEPIVQAVLPEVGKWLPFAALAEMWVKEPLEAGLGQPLAWAYSLAAAIVALVAGSWLTSVRDA
jgi:ABC-2 type transport system permease protein